MFTTPLDGKGLEDRFNISCGKKKKLGSGLTKIRDKITRYYENIELHDPTSSKKKRNSFSRFGILRSILFYLANTYSFCLLVGLFFLIVSLIANALKASHCVRCTQV